MSLQKSKLILEKIATLHHNMSLDDTQIAPIERDLMLSYVRQLYEHFLELPAKQRTHSTHIEPTPVPVVEVPKPVVEVPKPVVEVPKPVVEVPKPVVDVPKPVVEVPKPVVDVPKPVVDVPKPVVEVPKPVVEVPKPVVEVPKPMVEVPKPVIEVPKPVVEVPKPVVEVPKPVVEVPKPVVEVPKPVVEVPKPVVEKHKHVIELEYEKPVARQLPSEIKALFEITHGTELLDRLAQSPIADLNRAFSFNDRLLYSNELFGTNINYFNETVKAINLLPNYEAAQSKLEDLAILFHWIGTEDRKKAARNFLKLVRRRFK
jgi:hypothetical protein